MDDVRKVTREHLEHFGSSGLRTLCLAYKDLNPEAYDSWNEKFVQAKSALRDREKKLDEVDCYFVNFFLLTTYIAKIESGNKNLLNWYSSGNILF